MDNYAIYLRKSRADLELESMGQGETLARHRSALLDLAKRQQLNIVKIYDEIVSGESIASRPQMQQLLSDVWAGEYKGVLVMEIERLARGNTKDQGEVSEAFVASKTLIVTPSKTYDPTDEFDEEYFEFGLFMSRREYKTIRRRMQRGLMASIKEGNYVGSKPPYGYAIKRINKKERTLVPNEQSEYVKMMFDWFVNERLSTGQIAKRLTEMGVPTLTGKSEWNRGTIRDILENDLYTGKIRWNRRKVSKEYEEGVVTRKRRLTPDDYLLVPGKHPAIIDDETFALARSLKTGNVPIKAQETLVNPFARLMFCAHCGKAIAYQGYTHKKGRVRPRIVHRESYTCKVKSAPYTDVMNAVIAAVNQALSEFEFQMNDANQRKRNNQQQSLIDSLTHELSVQESKREKLFEFLESGIYTTAEFMERKDVINERIDKLNESIREAQEQSTLQVDYREIINKFSEVLNSLQNDSPAKEQNNLLKSIIDRIDYDCIDLGRAKGGELSLQIHFKDQYQALLGNGQNP